MIRPTSVFRKFFAVSAMLICGATAASAQNEFGTSYLVRNGADQPLAKCSFQAGPQSSSLLTERVSHLVRPLRHNMTVSQLAGVGMTVAQVDTRLDRASTLIQVNDWAADAGCCFEMRRSGPVDTIGTMDENIDMGVQVTCGGSAMTIPGGIITSQAQLDAVKCAAGNQDGNIIIVNGLMWCSQAGSSIGGCSGPGGAVMVISTTTAAAWAHEFGHVRGLSHKPFCSINDCNDGVTTECNCATAGNAARNIMFCANCLAGLDTITVSECTQFQNGATP